MNAENLSKLSSVAEIASSIAVLITLIFLVVQVAQNNDLLELQETNSQRETRRDIQLATVSNPEILNIMEKMMKNEELSFVENGRVQAYSDVLFSSWEWEYLSDQRGSTNFPMRAVQALLASEPPMLDLWNNMKFIYRDDFVQFMDTRVISDI